MAKNPVDAVSNAASGVMNTGKSALGSAWGLAKGVLKVGMFVGGLVGVFALVGAATGGGGLAALAPHVNLAFEGVNNTLAALSSGASWVGGKLAGASIAAPALG